MSTAATRARKTTARKYLDARAKKKRVGEFIKDCEVISGGSIMKFADGSVVWMHARTSSLSETNGVDEAKRLLAESLVDPNEGGEL